MRRWAELVAAATLLTRLPVGRLAAPHPAMAECVWAYPLVGLLVGGLGALLLVVLTAIGLPQPVAAVWTVAATVLVTGGLHEDGLADTADGFGGGRTTERKLAIMRDSRIGSFGALALGFSLLLRVLTLSLAAHPGWAILWASGLGRGAILLPLVLLRPARADGLAATLDSHRLPAFAGLAICAAALPWASAALLAAALAGLAMAWLARRHVGGYTGDVLGAAEQVAECAALSILAR